MGKLVNIIVFLIGVILIIVGVLLGLAKDDTGNIIYIASLLQTVLISVGASLLATSIASFLTNRYLMKTNEIKEIIDDWGLLNIYEKKEIMNETANKYLEKCEEELDIVAVGMGGYINAQGPVLKDKLRQGIHMRIIACNPNSEQLEQREKDETSDGGGQSSGSMCQSIIELIRWKSNVQSEFPEAKIEIRFHNTYPGFSYLRIDDHCFISANLYFIQSQYNMAFEFGKKRQGFKCYDGYFNRLWTEGTNSGFLIKEDKLCISNKSASPNS